MSIRPQVFLLLAMILLAGCGPSTEFVREKLDPVTVATVKSSSSPLIFYNDNSAHAAHSRDFVYVGPVEVNRMGSYRYYLWFGVWSTIPSSPPTAQRDGFESITLFADGEPLQLVLAGWGGNAIGLSESVYVKPVASAAEAYYEVTIDQIRLIAGSTDLRMLTSGPAQSDFELWDNQQSAFSGLREFLEGTLF